MAPEELAKVITATRIMANAGLQQSIGMGLDLCKEAERLVERVRVLEEELRISQLRARSAEGITGMSLPQVIQALKDS